MNDKKYIINSKHIDDFQGYKGEEVIIINIHRFNHCTIESTLTGRIWYANILDDLIEINEVKKENYLQQ